MPFNLVNLGTSPTGVGGDTVRSGNVKLNANFQRMNDFGLLDTKLPTVTNFNDAALVNATYRVNPSATGGPPGAPTGSILINNVYSASEALQFVLFLANGFIASRAKTGGAWGGWNTGGIGTSSAPLINNFADDIPAGFYHAYTSGHPSATPGGPPGVPGGAFAVTSLGGLAPSYKAILAVQSGATPAGTRVFVGTRTSTTALYWNELIRRGDFGIGSYAARLTPEELEGLTVDSGLYDIEPRTTAQWPRTPFPSGWTRLLNIRHNNNNGYWSQLAFDFNIRPRMKVRGMSNGTIGEWAELYSQNSILGTVGQAAGVPTGAIIEHGANAGGRYTKFADGTLIQWGQLTLAENVAIGTANSGGGFRSYEQQITFPVGFAARSAASDQPICTDVYIQNNSAGVRAHPAQDSGIFVGSFVLETTGSTTTVSAGLYIRWKAIGRWF